MMKLAKRLFLLIPILLVGCVSRGESNDSDPEKEKVYPTVDPVLSLSLNEDDDTEVESFVVGNSYLAAIR